MTAELVAAVDADLARTGHAVAACAAAFDVRLLVAIGSYGQGLATYARQPDGRLRSLSDLDLVALVGRPVRRAALPRLSRRLTRDTGLPAWISAMTSGELARREPAQLWWEAAWRSRVIWGDAALLVAFAPFRDYTPGSDDAWRLVLNRYAALALAGQRERHIAAHKAVRAALDAALIVRARLPVDVAERAAAALQLGPAWAEAAELYRRFVAHPIVEPGDTSRADAVGRLAVEALRRVLGELPPRGSGVRSVRFPRPEIASQLRLVAHGVWLPGWPVEEAVFCHLEGTLRSGEAPSRRALRAWQLLQH